MWPRRFDPRFAAALVGLLAGCGQQDAHSQPTARLIGEVTIGGQPIPADADGMVDFHPVGGGGQAHPTSARIDNGRYDAPDVPHGSVLVLFNSGRFTGRMISEDGGTLFPEKENLVPLAKQQGVQIEVTGDGRRDFDL